MPVVVSIGRSTALRKIPQKFGGRPERGGLAQYGPKDIGVPKRHICGCEAASALACDDSFMGIAGEVVASAQPRDQFCCEKLTKSWVVSQLLHAALARI